MAYVTLEDMSGTVEMIVFPKKLNEYSRLLNEGQILYCQGRASLREEKESQLVCDRLTPASQIGDRGIATTGRDAMTGKMKDGAPASARPPSEYDGARTLPGRNRLDHSDTYPGQPRPILAGEPSQDSVQTHSKYHGLHLLVDSMESQAAFRCRTLLSLSWIDARLYEMRGHWQTVAISTRTVGGAKSASSPTAKAHFRNEKCAGFILTFGG